MIHKTRTTIKFKRFVRLIRPLCNGCFTAETIAVGLLESLWHATITNALEGNIGKLTDEDIAEELGWLGDASLLVDALVQAGWLDRCSTHRLVIHDWHDHAPDFVKGNLIRHNKEFAIATCPGQPTKQPAIATCPSNTPNLTKPNRTDGTELTCAPASPVSQFGFEEKWEEIRTVAKRISETIDPGRRLTARNRDLTLHLAGMAVIYPESEEAVLGAVERTGDKIRSSTPPDRPWGYLKDQAIRGCRDAGLQFDQMWGGLTIPEKLLKPPPKEPSNATKHSLQA
jgi:hypothetical protein